jgi:hypothetical protein
MVRRRLTDKSILMKTAEPKRIRPKEGPWQTWIALLPVAALLVAGCGGGTERSTSGATAEKNGSALTKAELIEQGDAICAKVYAATGALNPEGTSKEGVRVANLLNSMIQRLLALGTPQETEYSYAEYTTAAHALKRAEGEVTLVARRGDPAALRLAESGSLSSLSMFEGLAGQYGFKDCAEGAS